MKDASGLAEEVIKVVSSAIINSRTVGDSMGKVEELIRIIQEIQQDARNTALDDVCIHLLFAGAPDGMTKKEFCKICDGIKALKQGG